jgi:hypothetical protein
MADNDYNIIKPVEGLHNIGGLTPVNRRQERKRKHNLHEQSKEESGQKPNGKELAEDQAEQQSIDYCA